jgi:hypothetical protein
MLRSGPGFPVFEVRLRNTGDRDLVLNVGMLLGTKQYPDAIHFTFLNDAGLPHELIRKDTPGAIAGALGPLIVSLPMEASFSFPVDLARYCTFEEGCPLRLRAGGYTLRAIYDSSGERDFNIFHLWRGRIQSQPVPFAIVTN